MKLFLFHINNYFDFFVDLVYQEVGTFLGREKLVRLLRSEK